MEPAADEQEVPLAIPATARLLAPESLDESPDDAGFGSAATDTADAFTGHVEQTTPPAMQQSPAEETGGSDTPELEPETTDLETQEANACEIVWMAEDSGKDQELCTERRPTPTRRQRSSLCDRLHAEHAEKLRKRQQQRDAIARKADEEFQELQNRLARRRHTSPATLRIREKIMGKGSKRPPQYPGKTDAESNPCPEPQAEGRDCEPEGRETSTSDGEALSQAGRAARPRAKVLLYRRGPAGPFDNHISDDNQIAADADLDNAGLHTSDRHVLRRTTSCPPPKLAPLEAQRQRRHSFELPNTLREKLDLERHLQLNTLQAEEQQECPTQSAAEVSILAGELLSQAAEVLQDMEHEAAVAHDGQLSNVENELPRDDGELAGEPPQSSEKSVFDRLHAVHAEKLSKFRAQREDNARQEEEELKEARKGKRSNSVVREIDREKEPVWDKLHAVSYHQNRKRFVELERRAFEEAKWMERNSVHRNSNSDLNPRFDRLHEDHHQRQQRLEQARTDLAKNFWQGSVHAKVPCSPATVQQATERLYKESVAREERLKQMREAATSEIMSRAGPSKRTPGQAGPDRNELLYENALKKRQERQEQMKKKAEEDRAKTEVPVCKKRISDGQARSEHLYRDADRRNRQRQEQQMRARMEEYERQQQDSIHGLAQKKQAWVVREPLGGDRGNRSVMSSPSERHGGLDVDLSFDDFHDSSWMGDHSPIAAEPAFAESQMYNSILDMFNDAAAAVEQQVVSERPSLETFGAYIKTLRDTNNRHELVLSGLGLNGDNAEALAEALRENTTLQHLDLAGNHVGPVGGQAIAKALLANCSLERLDLCGNDLGSEGGQALAEFFRGNCALRHLNLGMNCLGPEEGRVLAEALSEKQSVRELHLSCNELGNDGAVSFAVTIKENHSIQVMNLSNNGIDVEGGRAVAQALLENCTLKQLDFSGNDLGVDGGRAFAEVLVDNPSIQHLCLSGNMIGAEGGQAFADVLKRNCILRQLDLSMNALGVEGAQAMAEALRDNRNLEHLDLGFNKFRDEGGQAFAEACTQNHFLQHLDLTSNLIGSCVGRAWCITVEVNRGLQRLLLQGNDIPPKDLATLEQALAFNKMPDLVVTLRAALFNVDDSDLELSCTSAGGEELARIHVVPDQDCLGKVRRVLAEQLMFPVRKLQLILPDGKHLAQSDDGVPFIELLGQDRIEPRTAVLGHASGTESSDGVPLTESLGQNPWTGAFGHASGTDSSDSQSMF